TKLAAVVPVDIGWADVGSWSSGWGGLDHDPAGNATEGPAGGLGRRHKPGDLGRTGLTPAVGGEGGSGGVNEGRVLVAARDKAEEVKALVDELKVRNYRAAVEHRRIYRPWGYYQDVDNAARYKVKRIVVKPGSMLSLQKHFHRSEHWVVAKGTAEVTL